MIFSMTRSGCDEGWCPAYTIAVFDDGRLWYFGREVVEKVGEHKAQVPPKTIDTIRKELRHTGFTSLAYDCCSCGEEEDAPFTTTLFYNFGVTEHGKVVHDTTCSQAPTWLAALEDRIDRLLNTEQFVGTYEWWRKHAGPVHVPRWGAEGRRTSR